MPPKKKTQFVFPITSQEQFLNVTSEENNKLTVIDIHLNWCGSCEAMASNYQAIWFNYDNPEARIEFFSCEETNIDEETLAGLKEGKLSCKPRFLVYN